MTAAAPGRPAASGGEGADMTARATPRLVRPHARVGTRVRLEDGGEFAVFRETTVAGVATPRPAVLAVRFHLRGTRPGQRWLHRAFQRACILTTPFFARTPGYRTKLWAYDGDSGDYAGITSGTAPSARTPTRARSCRSCARCRGAGA